MIVADRMGFTHISLIAGGGRGHNPHMIGYFFWPKLGFDALLEDGETVGHPEFAGYRTCWRSTMRGGGSTGARGGWNSIWPPTVPAWRKLPDYLREKELM
ncbi:MAG: hypothetical protein CBARDMAM_0947 [uncultured Caballeronia sp.]|nr:MAG: hypothetical protein CBARDMAM_0947 [uncultured Caballeronia sp.]